MCHGRVCLFVCLFPHSWGFSSLGGSASWEGRSGEDGDGDGIVVGFD